jgi:23S rRNA pseudouridine1911/1915/1917 synthase
MRERTFTVSTDLAGQTLAAALHRIDTSLSWSKTKRCIVTRRVEVNGVLCLNDARRMEEGDVVGLLEHSRPPVPKARDVRVLHVDSDLIVVDKPAGVMTLRRQEEEDFAAARKELQPSLEEMVQRLLMPAAHPARPGRKSQKAPPHKAATLYAVHRLDRDTSGLLMFALSPRGRDLLIGMFSRHEVRRAYLAVVHGSIARPRTMESWLVRDRGDGLRGSSALGAKTPEAKRAVTQVKPLERIDRDYTLVECRLETGRTHQIRIHLAEIGHMLCGEKLYVRPRANAPMVEDTSGAPRQALHSAEMEFVHPVSGKAMHFVSPLSKDLGSWLERLRG